MFYKKVNKKNNKEMFDFLKGHFQYFTMNSWNREKSIANNVLDCIIEDSENYEEFKEQLKENGLCLKEYQEDLTRQVDIVQSFDKLCDELLETCKNMLENCTIEEKEITVTKTEKVLKWNE